MNNQFAKAANGFWNDKNNISWFDSQPYSPYWVDFFSKFEDKENKKVLDLGCGAGRNTEMLIKFGFDVYSCDFYQGMVDKTKKRLCDMGISLKQCEDRVALQPMTNLKYPDAFFDVILSHGVYHNAFSVEEFSEAVAESARILKKDGFLCFNIFSSLSIESSLKKQPENENIFKTKEGLAMVLLSKDEFLAIAKKYHFVPFTEPVEYTTKVSTGERSVMRGVLQKVIS